MAKIEEILVLPHTHHDLGYTHVPDVCIYMHERAIHDILALCDSDDDIAAHSFRWTMEITRPVVDFLRHASPQQISRLQALVERGRIALTGAYMHMTQLIGHEDYVRFFYPLKLLRTQFGLPISVVQHGDINGLSWGVVSLMRALNLHTLVMALNPDHGRAPFEQPSAFWWEGQDGSRVLVWLSLFYSLANNPWRLTTGEIEHATAPLQQLVKRLEARDDYPFNFAVIHSAEDNMLPNDRICRAVREWNAGGLQPSMRIVTIDQAMARAHSQAAALPIVRGEWADWWAHGHGSTAYEVGLSRLARAETRAAEASQALSRACGSQREYLQFYDLPIVNWYRVSNLPLSRDSFQERVNQIYVDLLVFEEHTWGTFESFTHPQSDFTRAHWHQKANFAYRPLSEAHNLARESLTGLAAQLPESKDLAVVAFNPLSAARDELVTVRTPGINHTVLVRNIPPLGVRVIPWDAERFDRREPLAAETTVENNDYRLTFDTASGAISHLYDKGMGREWVDSRLCGLGAVIYEAAEEGSDHPALTRGRQHFHPNTPGPRFTYTVARSYEAPRVFRTHYGLVIETESCAPFLPRILTTFVLHDAFKAIDITVSLDKLENYEMEGVYVAFPFALNSATFLLETANAVYRADSEQLPDTCRDWYSIQHGAGVTDGEASVLWATREAPLIQIGGFHTGLWRQTLGPIPGHINAWLMNNLYFTNFKAAQSGHTTFSFRFATREGSIGPADVRRWGELFANPPIGRVARVQPGKYTWLQVDPETVQVQILKPAESSEHDFVLRLKECAGRPTRARIVWKQGGSVRFSRIDLLETTMGEALDQDAGGSVVDLGAHELLTLYATLAEAQGGVIQDGW